MDNRKDASQDLIFEEISEDTSLENSAGCKTHGASTCCTTYCTDHGPDLFEFDMY